MARQWRALYRCAGCGAEFPYGKTIKSKALRDKLVASIRQTAWPITASNEQITGVTAFVMFPTHDCRPNWQAPAKLIDVYESKEGEV